MANSSLKTDQGGGNAGNGEKHHKGGFSGGFNSGDPFGLCFRMKDLYGGNLVHSPSRQTMQFGGWPLCWPPRWVFGWD